MASLTPKRLDSLTLSIEQASTLKSLGHYIGRHDSYKRQAPEVLQSLTIMAQVESTESSNRIEGIVATKERLEKLVLQSSKPRNRSEQEIAGYRDALTLIHGSAEHMSLSPNLILQLHSTISRYMPDAGGKWKMADNAIIEAAPDGSSRVRFVPTPAIETDQAIQKLSDDFHQAVAVEGREPLVVIPLAILDFLCVHPFRDGNGRIPRLLTLLLLQQSGFEVGRYVSLERVFEESKETYYQALEESSQNWHTDEHDLSPWLNYFWGALLRAYRELDARVGTVATGRGSKTARVRAIVARQIKPFAISDVEHEARDISRDMIRIVLNTMRDEGAVVLQGRGRGAKWIVL